MDGWNQGLLVCSKEKAKAKRVHDNYLQIISGSFNEENMKGRENGKIA